MTAVTYKRAQTHVEFEQGKQLFIEYTESLGFDLSFQNVDEEFQSLSTKYNYPDGALLLAYVDQRTVGCVAVKRFDTLIAELKRMYIKPGFRGLKIGNSLIELALQEAKMLGYKKIYLDTLTTMQSAQTLYRRAGFYDIDAYYHNPMDNVVYMEKILANE